MTSRSFPYTPVTGGPGAYCDALPGGQFVAYLPNEYCETHLGRIDFVDAATQPLWVRINPLGPFSFASVVWEGPHKDKVMIWEGGWNVRAETACGSSAVIYDNTGLLHVSTCGPSVGVNGWRYVTPDNVLVTGDATYGPIPEVPLSEWTQLLPDLYVGQGRGDGGVHVVDRGVLRELVPESAGLCRFVRARIAGDTVALAWWGQGTRTAELRWLTVDELRALPLVPVVPVPPPPPVVVPPTPPIEVPPVIDVPNLSRIVREVYETEHYSLRSEIGCGVFTEACAQVIVKSHPDFAHLRKNPGQRQFEEHAVDALLHVPSGRSVDIIVSSKNPDLAAPGWGVDEPHYTAANAMAITPFPVSQVQRPPLPFLKGMTAFDFGTHLNQAWLDLHTDYGFPVLRVAPQSVARNPRSLAEGLEDLEETLKALRREGLKALVLFACDTKDYGMSEEDILENASAINAICVRYLDVVVAGGLNEVWNRNEQPCMGNPHFLLKLDGRVDARIPFSWGAGRGSESISPIVTGGSWIAAHPDRGTDPETNGQIMADAQTRYGKPVVNQEDVGVAEPGTPGQRTWDMDRVRGIAEAVKRHNLRGIIYHTEAGLRARIDQFGDMHRAGARVINEVLEGVVTPPPTVPPVVVPPGPPPTPPASGHPILDAPLSPAYPVGYDFFVGHFKAIELAATSWYDQAYNRRPATSDVAHGLWRGLNEGERWGTLRAAWEDTWPGGAPR